MAKDQDFWQAILEQGPHLETLYADLQEDKHRIGSDIPSRYYRIYYQQQDKLTANQGQVTQARPEDYA